jgi:hypothetical protein
MLLSSLCSSWIMRQPVQMPNGNQASAPVRIPQADPPQLHRRCFTRIADTHGFSSNTHVLMQHARNLDVYGLFTLYHSSFFPSKDNRSLPFRRSDTGLACYISRFSEKLGDAGIPSLGPHGPDWI